MSVSHPLIKEIKGLYLKLYNDVGQDKIVTDKNSNVIPFCSCLEKIYTNGVRQKINRTSFIREPQTWAWIESLCSVEKYSPETCTVKRSYDVVASYPNTTTSVGKMRLFLRACLNFKCANKPLELLKKSEMSQQMYKSQSSILGDDILREMVASILAQCSKLNFQLDLKNASFLDCTWLLPDYISLELVPSSTLGISISFSRDKAIIVDIKPNSAMADEENVEIGDVLDELNGVVINSSFRGKIGELAQRNHGKPTIVKIIKHRYLSTRENYPPLESILRALDVELSGRIFCKTNESKLRGKTGFRTKLVGTVYMKGEGKVRHIEKAIRLFLQHSLAKNGAVNSNVSFEEHEVTIETTEMGIKVFDLNTNQTLFFHLYMDVSSCGTADGLPKFFAYMLASKKESSIVFTCFVFQCECPESIRLILKSIDQGFQRTHFAV